MVVFIFFAGGTAARDCGEVKWMMTGQSSFGTGSREAMDAGSLRIPGPGFV